MSAPIAHDTSAPIAHGATPMAYDDAVYRVPASTDPDADPERHLSHINDNRARLETRVKI